MLNPLLFELPAFLLGLLFGSFLNVCISRLPDHRSLSKPRSHCPHCQHTIAWYDNVPLLSWLILRARCRHCKQPISWRYPAVELAVAVWFWLNARLIYTFVFLTNKLGAWDPRILRVDPAARDIANTHILELVAVAILGFLLIGLLVMDWQTHTLPDAFTLTGTLLGFLLTCAEAFFLLPHEGELLLHGRNPLTSVGGTVDNGNVILTGGEHLVLGRLFAIAAAAGLFLFLRFAYKTLRHREGIGLGDIKLIAMITAFLGFWPAILAVFIGTILGASYAVTLLVRKRADATTRIPFGTFLAIGGLAAALVATPMIAWYSSLL